MWKDYHLVDKTGRIIGEVRPSWRGYVGAFLYQPGNKPQHLGDWDSVQGACKAVEDAHKNHNNHQTTEISLLARVAVLEKIIRNRGLS
ncbi:MAG: hypothetical protein HKM06_08635 [Spirochaetales bacterium]|nr:hypothetical protein [Spirochaetales bacterium]